MKCFNCGRLEEEHFYYYRACHSHKQFIKYRDEKFEGEDHSRSTTNQIEDKEPQDSNERRFGSDGSFNLSDKIIRLTDGKPVNWMSSLLVKDVKEFIRRLKELVNTTKWDESDDYISYDIPRARVRKFIDKLVGEKLQ